MNVLDHFYLIWVAMLLAPVSDDAKHGAVGFIIITWIGELVYKTWFI